MSDRLEIDEEELSKEFIEPAKSLVCIATQYMSGHDESPQDSIVYANQIKSYFDKFGRRHCGHGVNEMHLEFTSRRYRHIAGVSEFIDSMNNFTSSNRIETMEEEIGVMLGVMTAWGEWGMYDFCGPRSLSPEGDEVSRTVQFGSGLRFLKKETGND